MVAVIGDKRQATMPEVPTFAELGLSGFEELAYYGLFAPVGTPQTVIDRYSDALAKIIAQPEVKDRLTSMGINVVHMPPNNLLTMFVRTRRRGKKLSRTVASKRSKSALSP
jgi:tripartite-type tricarboxylate transporter receptor subunit TctC